MSVAQPLKWKLLDNGQDGPGASSDTGGPVDSSPNPGSSASITIATSQSCAPSATAATAGDVGTGSGGTGAPSATAATAGDVGTATGTASGGTGALTVGSTNTAESAAGVNQFDEIDLAVNGDAVHQDFGFTGAGVTIGIISNSWNSPNANNGNDLSTALADGLVTPNYLDQQDDSSSTEDEGLAMAELVHEIAPNARIIFYTGTPQGSVTEQTMSTAINALAADHVNIIMDDIFDFNQPFYQPGDLIDQAINNAVASGITYFALAGNPGASSYYASSPNSGFTVSLPVSGLGTYAAWNFGTAGNPTPFELISSPSFGFEVGLQWEQPWQSISGGSGSQYTLQFFLFADNNGQPGNLLWWGAGDGNSGDPVQTDAESLNNSFDEINEGNYFLSVVVTTSQGTITNASSAANAGHYTGNPGSPGNPSSIPSNENAWKIIFNTNKLAEQVAVETAQGNTDPNAGTGSGDVWGHSEDPNAITVGAVNYTNTPAFGGTLQSEPFSASGPGKYFFNASGQLLATPQSLGKVNISAPDEGATDVAGFSSFTGTSAATPAAAAVAALMLQAYPYLTPAQIAAYLEGTAIPFGTPAVAGSGFVNALAAVEAVDTPASTTADMIMREANGDYEMYDLGNNGIVGAFTLGQVGPEWQVAGIGNFFGTDTSDMILRDSSNGAFEIYDIGGVRITGAASMGQVGLEWQVSGFGDFSSRPNETDMLMRDSNTGQFEIYDLANNAIISAASMGQVGTAWRVAGFGDFSSRPNESDMLMRNVQTGQFEVYDISNNQLTSAASMGQVGLEWTVVGFGDFSGNANETDMLMRDSNNGEFEIYDISNNAIYSAAAIGQVGLEWQVAGFGPIDGAGSSDMLMRDTATGQFEIYDISNNQLVGAASMGQVGPQWSVAGIATDAPPAAEGTAMDSQLVQAMASYGSYADAADTSPSPDQMTMPAPAAAVLAGSTYQPVAGQV